MEAQSVRVLAPIPGSNHVGVEIPNVNPQTIYLKNVINSEKYLKSKAKLKLAIGKGTLVIYLFLTLLKCLIYLLQERQVQESRFH